MSFFVKVLGSGEKVRKTRQEGKIDKLPEREELLVKKKEFLKKKIDHEHLSAKKNCRKNRRAALQALKRKKWCEKHLNHIDCAVEAMTSAHHHTCSEMINKVNNFIRELTEEEDMLDNLNSFIDQKGEFDEDELLAELERLENGLDENLFEEDRELSSLVLPTASPSHPTKPEEDDDEDDLEYLRRWANESLLEKSLDGSLIDEDKTEDNVLSYPVLSTASTSHPANVKEDEDEEDLEYLRRWAKDFL